MHIRLLCYTILVGKWVINLKKITKSNISCTHWEKKNLRSTATPPSLRITFFPVVNIFRFDLLINYQLYTNTSLCLRMWGHCHDVCAENSKAVSGVVKPQTDFLYSHSTQTTFSNWVWSRDFKVKGRTREWLQRRIICSNWTLSNRCWGISFRTKLVNRLTNWTWYITLVVQRQLRNTV